MSHRGFSLSGASLSRYGRRRLSPEYQDFTSSTSYNYPTSSSTFSHLPPLVFFCCKSQKSQSLKQLRSSELPFQSVEHLSNNPSITMPHHLNSSSPPEEIGPARKRKSHQKSRRGCRNCKLRRVKVYISLPTSSNPKAKALSATKPAPNAQNAPPSV